MQNFGKIKNMFNEILAEGVASKNDTSKPLFKKYMKTLKENEILKTQFLVFDNIENKIEENEFKATEFVKANIELLKKFDKKAIIEANLSLAEPIVLEQKDVVNPLEKLHEDITTLIFTEKTPTTIDTILEATSNIVNYIKNNKPKEIEEGYDLPPTMVSNVMVLRYNEKYSTLDESEKKILKAIMESDEEQKKVVYSEILRECIDLVNAELSSDKNRGLQDVREKLLNVKDKLLNDTSDINENFEQKISKLNELRKNLQDK